MGSYVTGSAIKRLREEHGMTQRALAEVLHVSDKTVSKWETGRGLPDIALIEALAAALQVSIAELLNGEYAVNANRSGNMLKAGFNVCPVCGNIVFSTGEGSFTCHGISLPRLEEESPDEEHSLSVEVMDDEYHVSMEHPMEKGHFISFFAYVTSGAVQIAKLYPEQSAETRFRISGSGRVLALCNRHGLYAVRTPAHRPRRLS